ncbi:MAG: porphobilinogen synthase [Verrucomicrobia bacterium]|nr:porphobilinogen synthase [Verrucomicrobiota bacterium]
MLGSLIQRPRRNRKSTAIRALIEETSLRPQNLVVPCFVLPGQNRREEIPHMPGVYRLSIDLLLKELEALHAQGICAVDLFPIVSPEQKDPYGSLALDPNGTLPEAIRTLKKELPSLCLITDIALDPYTSHGHDGILNASGEVENDASVEIFTQMALIHAEAGVDFVAPSDMMDGRVGAIRRHLDTEGFSQVGIIAYTAKYASALYGPFRDTVGSTLKKGDKKGYQLNPANSREALREARLDMEEGADMLLIKPATFYLDIISKIREETLLPVCAYHVSGEYAMIMAAHERGILDATRALLEAHTSIRRAGADFIFSYAAKLLLPHL